ncbi:MmgE/PrpD family protein [uncultured Draconibacterium sp.]|uniref:MmgE/PrpD family protein n=1 Tax=uncultured Draconibacterium sp. TaxID=1573823 RepID=UPI0025FE20F5|nr:MmgE/PrpD family protein [uncultured Draconibacterium sp.]
MEKNITNLFIDEIISLKQTNFTSNTIHCFKRCFIDYLGATYAGAKMNKTKANRYLDLANSNGNDCTLLGSSQKVDVNTASYVNGLNSHIAELDDGVISGIIHPGAPVFSALLPIVEKHSVCISKFIIAGIIGYEVAVRLADAIQPSHKSIGYHATGTCGTIGAAISIAIALDLDRTQLKHAFSTAALSSYGTLKVLEDDSELKPFNVAKASNNGLIAAYSSLSGFKGPEDVLGGERGWFALMSKEYNTEVLFEKVEDKFGVERAYYKPYASCRYTHPSIDAAIKLRKNINTEDILSVKIETYYWAVYKHDHTKLPNVSSAKMSIPFSFALAFVIGKADINQFSESNIENTDIKTLTSKITVIAKEEYTQLFPQKSVAFVEVTLNSGQTLSEFIEFAKGEPENPLSDKEISDKFISLSEYGLVDQDIIKSQLNNIWNQSINDNSIFTL